MTQGEKAALNENVVKSRHLPDAPGHRYPPQFGMPICATGSRLLSNGHYTDCGSVTQLDVAGSAGGTTVLHLGRANLCVNLGGNSGGPFYKNGNAYGLFSIGVSACDVLYQGAIGALNGSNVHLPG